MQFSVWPFNNIEKSRLSLLINFSNAFDTQGFCLADVMTNTTLFIGDTIIMVFLLYRIAIFKQTGNRSFFENFLIVLVFVLQLTGTVHSPHTFFHPLDEQTFLISYNEQAFRLCFTFGKARMK